MRRALPYVTIVVLAAGAGILLLNLRERDLYLDALSAPPPGPRNVDTDDGALSWLSREIEHDGCTHAIEVLENHRWMSLRDQDGWYRLFWAADDWYYFADPSPFNVALGNPTARDPSGEWRIHVRYVHPTCPVRPEIRVRYRLAVRDTLAPPAETAAVPLEIRWMMTQKTDTLRVFVWNREELSWSE
jgi:hypothetical protein